MKLIWILVGISFINVLYAQADNVKPCQALVKCLQSLQDGEKQCETNFPNSTTKHTSNACKQTDIEAKLKQKKFQQHSQYLDCLKARQGESYTSFKNSDQQERCEYVVCVLSSNSTETSRQKRSVSNSSSTENHSHDTNNQITRGNDDDDKDSGKKVEHKKHHDHGSHEHSHSSHGHGHHEHGSVDDRQKCLKKLSHKRSQCRTLTTCCTETKICSIKFKLTSLSDEISQLQLDMAVKEHDCKKSLAQKQANSTSDSDSMNDEPITGEDEDGLKFIKYMLSEAEGD